MNSGPERKERLSFDVIRKVVFELNQSNPLQTIIFAGGEPTLLGEQLLDAIAFSESLGISTRLVTNAYWATSPSAARAKVVALREAGLTELNISADDYHLPFIPFERVKYAWNAARNQGFRAVVIANCYGPNSTITPEFIEHEFGPLSKRFDSNGMPQKLGQADADGTVYALSNSLTQKIGRGFAMVPTSDVVFPKAPSDLEGPCPWAIRSSALSPAGHLVACCGIEAESNAVLDFGEAIRQNSNDLIANANGDPLVLAIALLGPAYLKKFIAQRCPEIDFSRKCATVCEVCEDIVNRKEVVQALRAHQHELAVILHLLRTVINTEISP